LPGSPGLEPKSANAEEEEGAAGSVRALDGTVDEEEEEGSFDKPTDEIAASEEVPTAKSSGDGSPIASAQRDVPAEEEDSELVVRQAANPSDGDSNGHLISKSSLADDDEGGNTKGDQPAADHEEEIPGSADDEDNKLGSTDGMLADTSKAELSACDREEPHIDPGPKVAVGSSNPCEYGQTASDELPAAESSSNSFSSSHGLLQTELPVRKPSVSFEQLEEANFEASRGCTDSELSGPIPKQPDADVGDSSPSDFECENAQPRVSFLQGEDGTAFDASRGERFTTSDVITFDEPSTLPKSTSSDFEPKPNVIALALPESEPSVKALLFAPLSRVGHAFSVWKSRFKERQLPSFEMFDFQIDEDRPVLSPIRQPQARPKKGSRLTELAERYELMAQIEYQQEINAKLKERLEQMERENVSTQRGAAAARPEREARSPPSLPTDPRTERPRIGASLRKQDI
jgi:hypothetical protein